MKLAFRLFCLLLALLAPVLTQAAGTRYALVIGIDEYQNMGGLKTCGNDARELARALVGRAGFPQSQVVLLTDDARQPQNRPTMGNMLNRMTQYSVLPKKEDTVLIFFSGHGVTVDGEGFLVPSDGGLRNAIPLRGDRKSKGVIDLLESCKAKTKLLVLDCCHAGSATKGVSGIAPSLASGARSVVMMLSCGQGQLSHVDDAGGHSVFSKFLLEGVAGSADADKDQAVTVRELFAHVDAQMRMWCLNTGKTQTPVMYPDEFTDLPLARPVEATVPPPQPPEPPPPAPDPPKPDSREAEYRKAIQEAEAILRELEAMKK